MAEYFQKGWTAKPVRRKEIAQAQDPLFANCRPPHLRIGKQSFARG